MDITTNWKEVLESLAGHPGLWRYQTFINTEKEKFEGISRIFPPDENIFRCFNYFNQEDTKVVIIGQDPYHGFEQANGLAFSVNEDVKKPPSLKNIEKELGHAADIESWAKQGVLMLNAALTVRERSPESHMKYWLPITSSIILHISENCKNVVFVAWGGFALNLLESNVDTSKHTLIVSSHPSLLGAYKPLKTYPGFIGSDVFNKVNASLTENDLPVIVW